MEFVKTDIPRPDFFCPRCGFPLNSRDDQGDGGVTCPCGAWVPLPEEVRNTSRCEVCNGSGFTGEAYCPACGGHGQ